MKTLNYKLKSVSFFLVTALFFFGCKSTTMITSTPDDAKVYLNGKYAGNTPYKHSDMKISGAKTNVAIEKEGYETLHTFFKRNEKLNTGALIAGCMCVYPLLWVKKYNPEHNYELTTFDPVQSDDASRPPLKFKKTIEPLP